MEVKSFEDIHIILDQFKETLYAFMPRFLTALVIIVAGVIVARIVRFFIVRFISHSYRLIPAKFFRERFKNYLNEKPIATIVGSVVFWFLVLFVLTMATETIGLPVVTTWLKGIGGYLPKILLALLIIIAGIIGSVFVRDLIKTTFAASGFIYIQALSRLSQIVIVLISILIAIDQIGVDVNILTNLIVVSVGALMFGAVLAFGLGAKMSVMNIISSYYIQKTYKVGDLVKIGEHQGRIIELTSTAVVMDASEGRVNVPAKEFSENVSVLLTEGE